MSSTSRGLLNRIQEGTNFLNKIGDAKKFFIENYHVGFLNPDIINDLNKSQLIENREDGFHLKSMSADERSRAFAQLLNDLRQEKKYTALRGWRDELYDVWVEGRTKSLMKYERSAAALFGFTTYGVHINGYVRHPELGECMWVGRRSKTKQTYPNKLDQIVAGGLTSGLSVMECCQKEGKEEASLPNDLVSKIVPTGVVTCFYEDERGICPEYEYVFDLELPQHFQPKCQDGEMDSFLLLPYQEVLERVAAGEFKLNCGLICIDFLIRHGVIRPDQEPNYNRIVSGSRVRLPQD